MLGYRYPKVRTLLALLGVFLLFILLVFHTIKDLNSSLSHWYFKATWVWLIVMTMGSVWFFLFWLKNKNGKSHFEELPEGKVRVSARSKFPRIDVCKVCKKFNGGGHPMASGARVDGTLEQVKNDFLKALSDEIRN